MFRMNDTFNRPKVLNSTHKVKGPLSVKSAILVYRYILLWR